MFDILTPEQMGCAEQASVKLGTSLAELMDNAGYELYKEIYSSALKLSAKKVLLIIGKGNNGGDGLVAANLLYNAGFNVEIYLPCGSPATDLSSAAFDKLVKQIPVICNDISQLKMLVNKAEIIVDCVFGTGFHGSLRENILPVYEIIENSQAYKIACDVPSGVNSLNGYVSKGTVHYNKTVTFHRAKIGMLLSPAKDFCGKISTCDISIPDGWENDIDISIQQPDLSEIKQLLPERYRNSHKGTYGKLMLVCGCENYMGAPLISVKAALHSGVGITNLCTPKAVASALVAAAPECVFTGLSADNEGFISPDNGEKLIEISGSSQAMVIGCGLGISESTKELVKQLIKFSECPVILDADGINCICENIDILNKRKSEIILTPHPAELARLCGCTTSEIMQDRLKYAHDIAQKYGVTVHAKGTQTLTVTEKSCIITDFGNTALAKGGSGDMLAGLIGSFRAQGLSSENACVLSSALMGSSAEYLSQSNSERSILASDIINAFSKLFKEWE
ncbi:MAG: NAD(P)H-hydrate dehydratase [Oscillospiraceae bacterium]